jgi:Flp pilus assembly CpaE family ATPase
MASQTIKRLHSLTLLDRVSVLLNRMDKQAGLSIRDIESILGLPISVTLPADERGIREAVQQGTGINPKSALGKQIEAVAQKMAGNITTGSKLIPPRQKRRFVEFFSVPQTRDIEPWRQ